jgi:integrase
MNVVKKPERTKDLWQLTEGQRNSLVISIALVGHVLSYYGDNIWNFTPYIHTKGTKKSQKQIDFSSLRFRDGSYLIDPQHYLLLIGVKALLYVRLTVNSPRSGKPLEESSIIAYWYRNICPLVRWMVDVGHNGFSDLTPETCLAYVAHCRKSTAWEQSPGERSNRPLARGTLQNRFHCLEDLWNFRDNLTDALTQHPWSGQSAGYLAGYARRGHKDVDTEQIPDRLMVKLVQGSLHYVTDSYGERLLDCRDARDAGHPIDGHLKQLGLQNWKAVRLEIFRLITSCYVIIDTFSGMRVSEVLSLEIGCYYEHEGWDGATYGWLKGTTYKLEEDPKPGEWMVPPVVRQAVELAVRATSPIRAELEKMIAVLEAKLRNIRYLDDSLHQKDAEVLNDMKKHRFGLFLTRYYALNTISTISNQTILYNLNNFAKHLDLKVELADLQQVRNKSKVKVGDIWPLATHQFRRTFARYVARCILGDVRYLREHFKHWSLDMTLGYAWNEDDLLDPTLIDEILGEHQEIQSDVVLGWVDFNQNQHLSGVGGKNIESARERTRVLIATDPRAVAQQLSKGYFIRGLGHSWCTEKECRGKGIYSVTECKECENRVIDESHIPMWHGIRQQQIELLHIDDCGDPMWQGAVDSLRYAEQVLADLGEELEPYPVPPKPSQRRVCA